MKHFSFKQGFAILILFFGVTIKAQSIYDNQGKIKSIEQRRYEESQKNQNTYKPATEPAKKNNTNSRSQAVEDEPAVKNYAAPEYKFSSKVI